MTQVDRLFRIALFLTCERGEAEALVRDAIGRVARRLYRARAGVAQRCGRSSGAVSVAG